MLVKKFGNLPIKYVGLNFEDAEDIQLFEEVRKKFNFNVDDSRGEAFQIEMAAGASSSSSNKVGSTSSSFSSSNKVVISVKPERCLPLNLN